MSRLVWLVAGCALLAGCGSSDRRLGPGAWIPRGVALIRITSAAGLEPPSVGVSVTASRVVRQITAWIDQMKLVPRGAYSCPVTLGVEPTVSFAFRASAGGRVLARASETDPGYGSGPCDPLNVSVSGEGRRALVGGMFLERVERLLNVDLGFGLGEIVGTLSVAGDPSLPPRGRRLPAGTATAYLVNVYLAHPSAFPGYGNGPLFSFGGFRSGQFSARVGPGIYLLEAATPGQRPNCPATMVIVRVGHTTHADVAVGCATR